MISHRCWDLPAATCGPSQGHGCDASTQPIPPKWIRPRDAPLPNSQEGRNVVAILSGSNYQMTSRIWPAAGRELSLLFNVDTGSGVSLI